MAFVGPKCADAVLPVAPTVALACQLTAGIVAHAASGTSQSTARGVAEPAHAHTVTRVGIGCAVIADTPTFGDEIGFEFSRWACGALAVAERRIVTVVFIIAFLGHVLGDKLALCGYKAN